MTDVAHTGTTILYLGFSLLVVLFLVLDFVLLKAKGQHKVPVAEALAWAAVWFVAAYLPAGASSPKCARFASCIRNVPGTGAH